MAGRMAGVAEAASEGGMAVVLREVVAVEVMAGRMAVEVVLREVVVVEWAGRAAVAGGRSSLTKKSRERQVAAPGFFLPTARGSSGREQAGRSACARGRANPAAENAGS